ncbi:uncharacterized protein [Ptychodera flava]|uniref:uncharacterized protein isoform X2 n=1 Tax=Ptychodera flava TaxID=63121 RepID=UPI00396A93F6
MGYRSSYPYTTPWFVLWPCYGLHQATEFGVYLLEDIEKGKGQHCRLLVKNIIQYVDHQSPEGEVYPHSRAWDMSKWFSFVISPHGEIGSVYYPDNENMEVLTMKKMLVGLFTSKMHVTDGVMESGKEWTYKVTETGHEGNHESTYTGTPTADGLVFRRQKHGHIVPNAKADNQKEILYHSSLQVPHTIHIEETFSSPRSSPPDFDMYAGVPGDKRKKQEQDVHDYRLPEMRGTSTGTLKFEHTRILPSNITIVAPSNLINDSIQISMYPKPPQPLEELDSLIRANMTCVRKNKIIESQERTSCFNNLVDMVSHLSAVNTTIVAERYIKDSANTDTEIEERNIMIDVLGAVATETTQLLLTEMVFLSENPNAETIYRAMVHFFRLRKPPPKKFLNVLEEIGFNQKFTFPDAKNTTNIQHRALLALGSVAKVLDKTDPENAHRIVGKLEEYLGVHDPMRHRHTRSVLSEADYDNHLHYKANLIHALGNAGFDRSYEFFISYMNNTASPSLLRRSGVMAVSKYKHEQAADTLLDMALHDHEEHVRYTATLEYQRHPRALDLQDLMHEYIEVHTNQTHVDFDSDSNKPLSRGRRAIFKDFHFELKLPFIEWSKTVGNSDIGASIGFVMKNFLTLDLKKFSGSLDVHVEDGAWARAFIGIIGVNQEFLNARLCFKGSGSYGLNILQEYGFDDIIEIVELYDKVVNEVVNSVKNTIKRFKNLLSLTKSNVNEIFDDFVETVEDLPNRVRDFRKIGKDLIRKIGQYSELPDFITDVRNVVDRVNTLFHDIKTDVMKFYNAVVDGVKVTLPWAAQQIEDAIKATAEAIKKLFKSPRTAISDIAKSIYRMKAAIAGVLDAKTKIEDACFFLEGQRPYWFNLDDEIAGIWDDILKAKESLENAVDWIREGVSDDDPFKHFTGVELSTVRQQLIDDILGVVDDLFAPLTRIREVAEPFVVAYDSLIGTIEDIKDGYEDVKKGYEKAKTLINKIFGPKIGESFPRQIIDTSCGEGDYPSVTRNTLPGVDLAATEGAKIVAPFAGIARTTGNHQVTITMESELKNTEIILYNVDLDSSLEGHPISKDNHLGEVTSSGCSPNIVHFTMRSQDLHEYINPTRFFEKREMPPPGWHMHCDDYILEFDREVIAEGTITGGPKEEDTSPARTSEPDTSDLNDITSPSRRKRDIVSDFFDGAKDFVDNLGLPGIDELGPIFDFNMKDMKLSEVYDFLDKSGLTSLRERIDSLLEQLKSAINNDECKRPESMDIKELRSALKLRGKPTTGSKDALIERYLETEEKCFGMRNALTKNIYCTFEEHCLGVSCCMDLKLSHFHRSFTAYVSYDPCSFQLKLGADKWSKTFELIDYEFATEDTEPMIENLELLDAVQVTIQYKIEKRAGKIIVNLAAGLCATEVEECKPFLTLLDNAVINIPLCDETMQAYVDAKSAASSDDKDIGLGDMTLGELEELLDEFLIDEEDVTQLMKDLRKFYQDLVKEAIDTALSGLFGDKFQGYDRCMRGAVFFQHGAVFYQYTVLFFLGPIPMYFGVGSGGSYGMQYGTDICLLQMKAALIVRPQIGAQVYGYLGIWLFLLFGELRLTGYLLTVNFPTKAEVQFDHFPLDVGARMDMNLVPLRLELRALLIFELKIKIGWVKIHIRKVLINKLLWEYTTPMISGNLMDIGDLEPDNTPPVFQPIFKNPIDLFSEDGAAAAGKRAIQVRDTTANPGCIVRQLEGRDYTDPAFELSLAVEDDRSEVDMTFCVGTYKDGCDILRDQPMGGASTIVSQTLRGGVPLYFTITAVNSASATSKATCGLPTYDVTLPGGRVTADFKSTSNPNVLKASSVALDDSVITQREEAVGFGQSIFGDQVFDWTEFDLDKNSHDVNVGNDPLGTKSLEYFAAPRLGRLRSVSHHTRNYLYPQNCAKDCLALPPTKCLSFNYDYGDSGLCELLEEIEGYEVELHENGYFYNFERLGVGHAVEFRHDDVGLRHNDLHFFNLHLNNTLGFSNIISSEGIISDFVPPEPGPIDNAEIDEVFHETCTEYVPDEWENRCVEETPLPNHRSIIDGPGSHCVFNGHEPLHDMLYTRANKYVSANWDGFRDNETDIFGYTWTVGLTPCEDDVHPHKDPHSHLFDETEWTHTGIAQPLNLDDGSYHVSVRALNKVEFGGPLATTVCHSTPYIIDNSPPLVHHIRLVDYDEVACVIIAEYDVSDPQSGIREIDFGLGKSSRDVYLLGWQRHDNTTHVKVDFCIPDGTPAWIKVRAINNVDLRTIGHSDFPIIVDTSPPIAGDVFDGPDHGIDIDFQSSSNRICANWQNFFDPESGISKYIWGVGTAPHLDDIVSFHDVDHTESFGCRDDVNLTHNTMYYSTLFAFNAGHKRLNTSVVSDGVLFDATAPVEGELRDGLDPSVDMKYSSETATVSANWNGYTDPESGILQYDVSIYRQSAQQDVATENRTTELIHEAESVSADTSFIDWHHFHLRHGDSVYVKLDAINQAESSTITMSDGFVIDTTNPVVHFLGDGTVQGEDRQYSSSTSQLSANWDFEDPESGIEYYGVAIYETHGGTRRQIQPQDRNEWFTVPSGTSVWMSEDNLSLQIGGHYSIRVSAVNGAGLTTVHDTDGVIIDPTPPVMRSVYVGVLAGESEEIFDGFVLTTDENGILATWSATDPESGILAYWVAVGTTPGGTEISDYRSMGVKKDGYIDDLELQLYDDASQQPIYYVSVKAQNGAGDFSTPKISSPIKVLQGDIAGIVDDGPDTDIIDSNTISVDVEYQKEDGVVTAQFHGFESQINGIVHYEWAVGTEPRKDDVQPFSSAGIVVSDQHDNPGEGLSGSGQAQSPLTLESGITYYSSVRAITGADDVLDSVSDGFTVDLTAPVITINSLGVFSNNATVSLDVNSAHYQESVDSLSAEWSIVDKESRIQNSSFSYGSFPGASDIYDITDVTDSFSIANGLVKPVANGKPNILTLKSRNEVGLESQSISGSVTVDITPPVSGVVNCPEYSAAIDELSCSWSDFYDSESNIAYYELGIGTTEGDDSLFPFVRLSADTTSYRARDLQNGGLQHHGRYFTTVIAYNAVGLQGRAFSSPIIVDGTPPVAGKVVELTGVDQVDVGEDVDSPTMCNSEEDCDMLDVVCQISLTQMSVSWQPFTDPDTPITRYQVAIGTAPGGSQIQDFKDVPVDSTYHVFQGLDLSSVRIAYVTVTGSNAAGLTATAVSNGVFISRISQGLQPLGSNYVWDGDSNQDLDYQESNDVISGRWDFSGDPCPISKYEWSIMRFDGTVVQPMVELPDGQSFGMNDELTLSDGETYFLVVRATNLLGYSTSVRSDGISIKLEPLLPGHVRDGDVIGFDINYQPSVTMLSANWDGFGFEGLTPGDTRNREQQVISHYEVAAGTDRRYPTTRTDIHPFVDVGLNKSHTFTDLLLTPRSVTYYITVKAYSVSTAMVEQSSNGIQVGYGGKAVALGEITVPRYVSSTSEMTISWTGFEFTMPIMFYQWGLGTQEDNLNTLTCSQLQNFNKDGEVNANPEYSHLFDKHKLTNVKKDTLVIADKLDLTEGQSYTVVVIATDEAAECSLATASIIVDTTPPKEGILQIGAFWNTSVMYSKNTEQLTVSWRGYHDDISGIKHHEIALYEGSSCQDISGNNLIQDFIQVLANDTYYTMLDLELKVDVPYYVHLKVTNNADLSVTTVSPPVLVDLMDPVSGSVKDGDNYKTDRMYQSSTSSMQGVFIHLPNPDVEACPTREFLTGEEPSGSDWSAVVDKGMWSIQSERRIQFATDKVTHSSEDGLTITMTRDVKEERMNSGAYYYTEPDITEGGKYQVEILAAGSDVHAVTSLVMWDGPAGVVGDFEAPLGAKTWQDTVIEREMCSCCMVQDETATEVAGNMSATVATELNSTETVTVPVPEECNCNCTEYLMKTSKPTNIPPTGPVTTTRDRGKVIEDELPGKTYTGDETMKMYAFNALGLQLHSGVEVDKEIKHFAVVWSRHENDTFEPKFEIVELSFDPSIAWHSYTLQVTIETVGSQNVWTVELFIDDIPVTYLSNIYHLTTSTKLLMSVWNRVDFVPDIADIFNPPSASASFKFLRLPPPADSLCRYGDPFRGGDNAIEAFLVGVGSERLLDDVVPFRQVVSPCVPCVKPCDVFNCQTICSDTKTSLYHIELNDLDLQPERIEEEDGVNTTVPATYYLTVKAITGSGRSATMSSNGVLVDVTPPIIEEIYHVDMDWSDTEPTEYQSSNSTIAVNWDGYDIGSQVKEFLWAIGTTPNGTDIQDFTSVGLEVSAVRKDLSLQDKSSYYVTVKAINNAGLSTTMSSTGVTVVLKAPDTSNSSSSSICNGISVNGSVSGVDLCSDQTSVGLMWEAVEGDDLVDQYYFSVGTSPDKIQDVIPEVQVGFNMSGSVHIENGLLVIGETPSANLSEMRPKDEEAEKERLENGESEVYSNQFLMERGRVLYADLKACNKGHRCSHYKMNKVVITGEDDEIVTAVHDGNINVKLYRNDVQHRDKASVVIATDRGQAEGTALAAGMLSDEDLEKEYTSDATVEFKPFVVNPKETSELTSRELRRRIHKFLDSNFYITSLDGLPINGKMNITVAFNMSDYQVDALPRLLYWNTELGEWHDSSHTCEDTYDLYHYDLEAATLTVQVCSTTSPLDDSTNRRRRETNSPSGSFSGPTAFSVAAVDNTFQNTPPYITSDDTVFMVEDSGTLVFTITALDDEFDQIAFRPTDNASLPDPRLGSANLTLDGEFTYRPCPDCYGEDKFYFVAFEQRADGIPSLSADGILTVIIRPQNDYPELFLDINGWNLLQKDNYELTITQEQRHQWNEGYYPIIAMVGAFDVDTEDKLTLMFERPTHGQLEITEEHRNVTFKMSECVVMEKKAGETEWPPGSEITFPCNMNNPHDITRQSWVIAYIKYVPNEYYYGEDEIKVVAEDPLGARSEILVLKIHIMENKCINGYCVGPESDPDCEGSVRSQGFHQGGYSCNCTAGYVGEYCDMDFDECSSNPCPSNYTCIDQLDSYVCHCANAKWPCAKLLTTAEIIGISVAVVAAVLIILIIALVVYSRYRLKNKKESRTNGSSLSGRPMSYPRAQNLYFDNGKPETTNRDMNVYQNPVFDATDAPSGSGASVDFVTFNKKKAKSGGSSTGKESSSRDSAYSSHLAEERNGGATESPDPHVPLPEADYDDFAGNADDHYGQGVHDYEALPSPDYN